MIASVPVPRLRVDVRVFIMSSQYNWNITLFGSCDLDCTCIARLETRSMYYGYRLLVGSNLAICHHLLWYKCRYKLAKLITIIFIIFLCCTYILGGMVIFLDVSRIISEGGKITVLAQITNRLYCSLRFLVKVAKYPLLAQITNRADCSLRFPTNNYSLQCFIHSFNVTVNYKYYCSSAN